MDLAEPRIKSTIFCRPGGSGSGRGMHALRRGNQRSSPGSTSQGCFTPSRWGPPPRTVKRAAKTSGALFRGQRAPELACCPAAIGWDP